MKPKLIFDIIESPDLYAIGRYEYQCEQVRIGSTPSDLSIHDSKLHPLHLTLKFHSVVWIAQVTKECGLIHNGKLITSYITIKPKDELVIGQTKMIILVAE